MKKYFKYTMRLAAWFSVLMLGWTAASCSSSNDDPAENPVPTVRLTLDKAEANKVTFTIATENAEAAAWLQEPDIDGDIFAEAIMAEGTKVNLVDGKATVTVEDLTANTEYHFAAVARSKQGRLSAVVILTVKTAELGSNVIAITQTVGANYADVDGKGNYTVMFAVGNLDASGMPERVGNMLMQLDLYADADSDPLNATLPDGTYTAGKQEVGTFNPSYTYVMVRTSEASTDDDGVTTSPIADGTVKVSRDGDIYTIDVDAVLLSGEQLRAEYKGSLAFTYAGNNSYENFTEAQNVTFDKQSGRYWGNFFYPHADDFALQFANGTVDENGTLTDGYFLYVSAYMPKLADYNADDPALATGTYTVCAQKSPVISYIPYDVVQGKIISIFESDQLTGSYLVRIDGKTGKQYRALLDQGTMTVTRVGSDYRVEFNFLSPEGVELKGTYQGAIHMGNYNDNDTNQNNIAHPWSTLDADVNLHFHETAHGMRYYMGEYMKKGYYSWMINIISDEPYRDDYLTLEYLTPVADGYELKDGEYTVGSQLQAYQLLPGFWTYGGGEVAYCWYGDMNSIDNEGYSSKLAPIMSGKMTVKSNGNDNYTFTFDFTDDANHAIKGTWTGKVTSYNATSEGSSAARRTRATASKKQMLKANRLLKVRKE